MSSGEIKSNKHESPDKERRYGIVGIAASLMALETELQESRQNENTQQELQDDNPTS